MTRPITDEDRRLFDGLTDRQIAAILAHEPELDEQEDAKRDRLVAELDARILHHFGYRGLCDFLDAQTGNHILLPSMFMDILNQAEKLEYARLAALRATIMSAPESSSASNNEKRKQAIKEILEPLEDED